MSRFAYTHRLLTHTQAVWGMVLITFLWSIAGVVSRQLEHARSFEVTFWRSLFTALSLLVILPLWQGPGVFGRFPWRSRAFWVSGLCWSVMFTAFMVALTLTSVANVLITLAVGPLLTALLARGITGQRLPRRTWVAIGVAALGIAWMFGNKLALGNTSAVAGLLVALCVPVAGAIHWTNLQRSQAQGQQIDLVPTVLLGAVISTLATLPLAAPFAATAKDVAWLALLGCVQLAIPCSLAVVCARSLKAPEVSLLGLLEVVFGIALAWAGAGEAPGPAVLAGGALVMGALAVNELLGWKQRRELEAKA